MGKCSHIIIRRNTIFRVFRHSCVSSLFVRNESTTAGEADKIEQIKQIKIEQMWGKVLTDTTKHNFPCFIVPCVSSF